jgi:hypothetical protein
LRVTHLEERNEALAELVSAVRSRLLAAQLVTQIRQVELPSGVDLQSAGVVARSAAEAVRTGKLGYALMIAGRAGSSLATKGGRLVRRAARYAVVAGTQGERPHTCFPHTISMVHEHGVLLR